MLGEAPLLWDAAPRDRELAFFGGVGRENALVWTQDYDPFGHWPVSTAMASLPVLVLLGLLAWGRVSAARAAAAGLVVACVTAHFGFGMPSSMVFGSVLVGMTFAVFRVIWLIVAAVFLYDLAVTTGQFEVMKASVAQLSADRRIQAVLVAFCFGAFVEGAAGFGAPVAISAAFLVGLGFQPFQAALLCLIANTAPVAWGAIGTPLRTLGAVTELDVEALSATSGRILPWLSLLIPFWLVWTLAGWRKVLAVWPPLLAVGGTFAAVQFLWSNFVGFELVDIVSSVSSLAAGVGFLRFWKPADVWRFEREEGQGSDFAVEKGGSAGSKPSLGAREILRAWLPFALLTATVLLWGIPAVKPLGTPAVREVLDAGLSWRIELSPLHLKIAKGEAVTGRSEPTADDLEKAVLELVPLSSTGTAVFLAAILTGVSLRVPWSRQIQLFGSTLRKMVPAILAILCMLALGFVTKYSGMDAVLGLAFTRTGRWLYPIFGTLLGWLGVALTGSDTSSNVLFGNLQKITAEKLGLNPILMAAANSTGGVMGKMIDAQSIVVAAAATGTGGREGKLLRAVFWHSLALALLVGAIVWLYAHAVPWMVVEPSSAPGRRL
jgi:lactate permease